MFFFLFSVVLWGLFFPFFFLSFLLRWFLVGFQPLARQKDRETVSKGGSPSFLLVPDVTYRLLSAHIWTFLLLLPKALAPTLVGTKLLLPMPPDRLRKSARRWVTQVAVLQARFCAVTLLQERKLGLIPATGPKPPSPPNHQCLSHFSSSYLPTGASLII